MMNPTAVSLYTVVRGKTSTTYSIIFGCTLVQAGDAA